MSDTVRPTKKQRELLDFINAFIVEHGYSPSYREIMNGCQYNSVATVALHVGNLIKRGHLRKRDHSARSLEVVAVVEEEAPKPMANKSHEAWLVKRIESYIMTKDEETQSLPDPEEIRTLVDALYLLGLSEQADELQMRLADNSELAS